MQFTVMHNMLDMHPRKAPHMIGLIMGLSVLNITFKLRNPMHVFGKINPVMQEELQ